MDKKPVRNIFTDGPVLPQFIAESIARHATKKDIGAHSIFLGQVRADSSNNQTVTAIEYSSNVEMALEKMHEIREALFAKYALTCMHVHHSLGKVLAGELCLFVFTSAKHRKAATDACAECVERIKAELPVWGKEIFEDDTYQWKVNS